MTEANWSEDAANPASMPVTLLIADDDDVTRSGLRMLLAAQPGIVVVGEASTVSKQWSFRGNFVRMWC